MPDSFNDSGMPAVPRGMILVRDTSWTKSSTAGQCLSSHTNRMVHRLCEERPTLDTPGLTTVASERLLLTHSPPHAIICSAHRPARLHGTEAMSFEYGSLHVRRVNVIDGITVVWLWEPKILTDQQWVFARFINVVDQKIEWLRDLMMPDIPGQQSFALVNKAVGQKIVLDFSNDEYFSSARLGTLITMDKKTKAANVKLRLCAIPPQIYEVFVITQLDRKFDIKPALEEALKDF